MLNQNPVADHHFLTPDVPPIDFPRPVSGDLSWHVLQGDHQHRLLDGRSQTRVYMILIYIHYVNNIYIHISHKALFVAFCFYPLDIVWCFFLVRCSEISAYGAFECKTKAFHCLWAVCSCCTSFNQLEPWVGAEVHLIAEEQLGEGAANPRKKGLRDSHLLRISYVYSSCAFLLNISVAQGSMVWCAVCDSFGGAAACFVHAISCPYANWRHLHGQFLRCMIWTILDDDTTP